MTTPKTDSSPPPLKPFLLEDSPEGGIHLLEANAGTGKTFSLCGIFLKFLYTYSEENLSVKNLVAITFTKAATQEIFARIKGDLEHFLNLISTQDNLPPSIDSLSFGYLLKHYYSLDPEQQKIKRDHLEKNLLNFDEHNIHTIHGFADKVIREYRLEFNLTSKEEIIQDDTVFFDKAFQDFWRHHFLDVDPYFLAYFETCYPLSNWRKILDKLYRLPTLKAYPLLAGGNENPVESWEACVVRHENSKNYDKFIQSWNGAKQILQKKPGVMTEKWKAILTSESMNKNKTKKLLSEWIRLEDFITGGQIIPFLYAFFEDPKLVSRFTTQAIESLFKKDFDPQNYLDGELLNILSHIDSLSLTLEELRGAFREYAFLLIHASSHYIKKRSRELRRNHRVLNFNDLLEILADGVCSSSPQGEKLIQELSRTYRVILIDEFQDTDPLQFAIFQKLLARMKAVYFISDPKQSIYSFRQANIHTYLQAKKSMHGVFNLLKNYRSDPLLLEGINHLYQHHPAPFYIPELKYHPSVPGIESTEENEKPLKIVFAPSQEPRNVKDKRMVATDLMTTHIRQQLQEGHQVAILVRKRAHGFLIHNHLENVGIPSLIHDVEDLFDTQEARDLYLLIKALVFSSEDSSLPISTYLDPRLLGALSSPLFLEERITAVNPYSDEELQRWFLKFKNAHQEWRRRGWYPMFCEFVRMAGIPSRLLGQRDGEPRYRRLLLLIEHIHAWENMFPEPLLQRLSNCINQKTTFSDSSLPSQAGTDIRERVRISTIHKSKGMEYDIVFLPFLDEDIYSRKAEVIFKLNSDTSDQGMGELGYDLGSDEIQEHQILSEQEILAEELRLLYVALTRAKKICYIYITPEKKHYPKSSLGYLLHPPTSKKLDSGEPSHSNPDNHSNPFWEHFQSMRSKSDDFFQKLASWEQELQQLERHPAIEWIHSPDPSGPSMSIAEDQEVPREFPPFQPFTPSQGAVYSENFQTSFTAMTTDIPHQSTPGEPWEDQMDDLAQEPEETSPQEDSPIDDLITDPSADPNNDPSADPNDDQFEDLIASFPPGTAVGLFIHEVLETMDFSTTDPQYLKGICTSVAQKYLGKPYIEDQAMDNLLTLLSKIQNLGLNFPDTSPIPLQEVFLENGKAVKEMEFTLSFSGTEDQLKAGFLSLLSEEGRILPTPPLSDDVDSNIVFRKGLIKGFIDLVFRYQGKYYLLDWKSNHLGTQASDYHEANLHQRMVKENYYFQAYLYTLALDRYLSLRLGESYDYQECFGGFAYIFLRGIGGIRGIRGITNTKSNGVITHKPSFKKIVAMREFLQPLS